MVHNPVMKRISALLDQAEEPILQLFEDGQDAAAIQQATRLKDFAVRYKAAPIDEFSQIGTQIADAARSLAMAPGADKEQVMQHLQAVLQQMSGQPASSGGKLADDQKQVKAARGDQFWDGLSAHLQRTRGIEL